MWTSPSRRGYVFQVRLDQPYDDIAGVVVYATHDLPLNSTSNLTIWLSQGSEVRVTQALHARCIMHTAPCVLHTA